MNMGDRLGHISSFDWVGRKWRVGKVGKLKASELKTKKPGLIADGGNLYLRTYISKDGHVSRGWIFRYQVAVQEARDMGLGSLDSINLAKARDLAAQYRELVALGVDPIDQRNGMIAARRSAEAVEPTPTFDAVAADYLAAHRSGWRSVRHANQWRDTLKDLRLSGHRQVAGRCHHHRSCFESSQAALV